MLTCSNLETQVATAGEAIQSPEGQLLIQELDRQYGEIIGQMEANAARHEREGTVGAPALDSKNNPASELQPFAMIGTVKVRTQYDIVKQTKSDYSAKREALRDKYPEVFDPKEVLDGGL